MESETTSDTSVSPSPTTPVIARPQEDPADIELSPATAPLLTPPVSPRRDDEFYCQDVVFLVDSVLFKVPRRPFECDSRVFCDMFKLPPVNSPFGVEGSNDENPIKLDGVTVDEFKPLLWVVFRSGYGASRTLNQTQWTAVLRLSTMWFFDDVRDRAITELSRLVTSPAARIVLARKYNIPNWLEPALTALAQQEHPLSAQDLEALGWETAAKLFQIRESVVFAGACVCGCNYCSISHGHIVNPPGGHVHAVPQQQQQSGPGSTRVGHMTVSALRKQADFSQKIRAVFGADLY